MTKENKESSYVAAKFAGTVATSVVAQPFVTLAAKMAASKATSELPYAKIFKNIQGMPWGCYAEDSKLILQRRVFASLMPSNLTGYLAKAHHMSDMESVAINTTIETTISSLLELPEKFNLANRSKFPLLGSNKIGLDLSKVDREAFAKSAQNISATFEELSQRQQISQQNAKFSVMFLALRNAAFSSAIFMAKPIAQDFVNKYGDQFEDSIDRDTQKSVVKHVTRLGFALGTTPFDSMTTRLCSGQVPAKEIFKQVMKNPRILFAGATARTALCFLTSSTVGYGFDLGTNFQDCVENYFEKEQALGNDLFKKDIDTQKEEKECHDAFKKISNDNNLKNDISQPNSTVTQITAQNLGEGNSKKINQEAER